jgi:hypothetical protein
MIRTITPIFSIIVAFVVFFFYTKPMFAEIKITQGEAAQYEEAASKAQELNAELARKLNEKRGYSVENLERLDALVPNSINEVKILADLSELARSHNMLFGNVNVENVDGGTSNKSSSAEEGTALSQTVSYVDIENASLTFSLIGTYEQFKAFLADVERSLVMMEITEIDFMTGEGNLQQYEVAVTLFALPPIQ